MSRTSPLRDRTQSGGTNDRERRGNDGLEMAQKFWTAEEDERLRKLASEGRSVATIAERLKRSDSSIRHRAEKLKISVAKVRE